MHHPTDRIAHTTAFVTSVVEHWLEREIAQWVHHEGSIRRPIAPWANALTAELHLAPSNLWRPVPVPVTDVHYNSLFWMCTLNTLTWPDLTLSLSLSPALWRKEELFLFNHALNTFYLRLYGVGHNVKVHSLSCYFRILFLFFFVVFFVFDELLSF